MSDRVDDNPEYSDEDLNSNESLGNDDQVKKEDLITYTADQLFALRQVSLSNEWPFYLDEAFKNNRGHWDPDRWHQNKKRGSTPPPEEKAGTAAKEETNAAGNKKKDIKDRLFMAETEGIVLSPQRRSFITGCQAQKESTKDSETNSNSGSTSGSNKPEPNLSLRPDSISNSARRVGSGRILSRDRPADFDHDQRFNGGSDRYGFNRNRGDRNRDDRNWYDRDYDQTRGGERGGRSGTSRGMSDRNSGGPMNSRKNDSRSNMNRRPRDSEPEWMSVPVNQDETFELKGFDDSPEKEPEKKPAVVNKQPSNVSNNTNSSGRPGDGDQGFNIDDILHMDVIPGLANILDDHDPNPQNEPVRGGKSESSGGSRFSQFFAKTNIQPEPSQNIEQRRSSIIDELGTNASTDSFLQDFLQKQQTEQQQTRIKIPSPGDPSAYFAPISPAAKTESVPPMNSIMEMLRKGEEDTEMPSLSHLKGMSDVKTAEEIEANIKHLVGLQREDPVKPSTHSSEGEMSAFKKFAAMVQGADDGDKPPNGNHMTHGPHQFAPPESHRGMLPNAPVIRPSPIPANAPTEQEILAEMALRQQEHLNRMSGPPQGGFGGMGGPQVPVGLGHGPGGHGPGGGIQPSREDVLLMISQRRLIPELLKTQEAISLQTAVQNGGGINMIHTFLYQFVYGQMEPNRREILLQVIKFYQMKGAYGPQYQQGPPPPPHLQPPVMHDHPSGLSPTSPTPGKNLTVSPIPGRDRVPSPQEMAIHAQQIMQNALIKRKLEEQKENYRRRQEQDQMRKATESPLLAFTPTVVMKKMAADRRDSDPKPAIPELKVSTTSGDKINSQIPLQRTSPGSPRMPPNMIPSQQQLLFMQQQQQIRAQQIAAAMQAGPPNMDPRMLMQAQMMGHGHVGPRPIPPPHQVPPGHAPFLPPSSQHQPGSGQLSRFFSPEVLAQAQAGNAPPLPPLPTQKAMTLEEIERQAAAVRI